MGRSGFVLVVIALALVTSVTPAAAAGKEWRFTDADHTIAGVLVLSTNGTGGASPVQLTADEATAWADSLALAAPAAGAAIAFTFDIGVSVATGSVLVEFGSIDPSTGAFTEVMSEAVNVSPPDGAKDTANGVLGRVKGTLTPEAGATIDAGAFPAVQLTPDITMLVSTTTSIGGGGGSTASIPLPELPALVLMGLGLVTVGGVAWARRGARWR